MAQRRNGTETRRAIIEAAGRLFAERGFSGVTAREVAHEAHVALSAIPYHFGSMEALYREALLLACQVSPDAAPLATQALMAKPDEALRTAIRWAITDIRAAASTWQIRLLFREEMDPSPAYREVLALKVVPEWNWLCEVVSRAARRPADSPEVKFGVVAMYSLTSSFYLQRGMLDHLAPDIARAITASPDHYVECMAGLTLDAVKAFRLRMVDRREAERSPASAKARSASGAAAGSRGRASSRRKGSRS